MLKILSTLFDRCLFTLTFILGLQLPEFIQQYSQRLSGHLNEALLQLGDYQEIADRHFDGNLKLMVDKYLTNSEPSINETAHVISKVTERVTDLQNHLTNLQDAEYINRVFYFITEFDESMAQATIQQYQLAIPLSLPALVSGTLFALCIVIFIHLSLRTSKSVCRKAFKKKVKAESKQKVIKPVKLKPVKLTSKDKSDKEKLKITPKIGDISHLN
ncbi:DUF2937 family protein [Pseudocolwellia agarivorans]|uniref:DUF2937 family protein n=1 Tax=Pseudocolwellia agarivorans TaxID=1911682 RepID=UPI003F883D16